MLSKVFMDSTGVSSTKEDALRVAMCLSAIKSSTNIDNSEELSKLRLSAKPWRPEPTSFHSSPTGYMEMVNRGSSMCVRVNGKEYPVHDGVFDTIYGIYGNSMDIMSLCAIFWDLLRFFKENGCFTGRDASYGSIYFTTVDSIEDRVTVRIGANVLLTFIGEESIAISDTRRDYVSVIDIDCTYGVRDAICLLSIINGINVTDII